MHIQFTIHCLLLLRSQIIVFIFRTCFYFYSTFLSFFFVFCLTNIHLNNSVKWIEYNALISSRMFGVIVSILMLHKLTLSVEFSHYQVEALLCLTFNQNKYFLTFNFAYKIPLLLISQGTITNYF